MRDAVAQYAAQQVKRLDQAFVGQLVGDGGTLPDGIDQAAVAQDLKMAGNGGLGGAEFRGQFGHVAVLSIQRVKQQDAGGVGESEAQVCFELGDKSEAKRS